MPIIFPFTETGATIAVILFFACIIYCWFTALYLDGKKGERLLGWRISIIFAFFICVYCEYSAVNIGFTIHPPKKANIVCKG